MLYAIATITAKPESVDTVRDILVHLVTPTRQESGCISYRMFQNTSDPTVFATMEEWVNPDAEHTHCASPHVAEALAKLAGHTVRAPDIQRYAVLR